MQAAQDAVEHYREEMQVRINNEYQRILKEAEAEAAEIISKAKQKVSVTSEQDENQNK